MTNTTIPLSSKIILELGGSPHRLYKAIEIYKKNLDAIILISSESSPQTCLNILMNAGVPYSKIFFNFDAWDTVTNFTLTFPLINQAEAKKLFVVTDRFHMDRAMTIANTVYFGTGVDTIPCESLDGDLSRKESSSQIFNNFLRALTWKVFGYTNYDSGVRRERWPGILAEKVTAEKIAQVV